MSKKAYDHTGEVFGKLTVISRDTCKNRSGTYWICRCECGREKSIRIETLKTAKTKHFKTCGLCPKPKRAAHYAWKGIGEISKHYFNSVWHSAKDRSLEFNVTMEYIWKLYLNQNGCCALTGWALNFEPSYNDRHLRTASLDRIDSSKGYVPDNLQWIHTDINYLKSNLDEKYLFKICKDIVNFRLL